MSETESEPESETDNDTESETDNEPKNEQEAKLIKILKPYGVGITKGQICLNDFIVNVVGSKSPKLYMRKINDKIRIKGNYYIKPCDCLEILRQSNFITCKKIIRKIDKDETDKTSIIDPAENIFQYEGHKFLAFFIDDEASNDWQVWVKGADVAQFLKYVNVEQAIHKLVQPQNKMPFRKLLRHFQSISDSGYRNIDKKTIFINLSGFFNLIRRSNKSIAIQMRSWIDNTVLPALVKHGSYTMQPDKINIKLFYDETAISTFYNLAVVYIAYIGQIKSEHTFKYGLSRQIFERDYEQHRKYFSTFDVVFIGQTDNCEQAIHKLVQPQNKMPFRKLLKVFDHISDRGEIYFQISIIIEHLKLFVMFFNDFIQWGYIPIHLR
jgi:prophage antirepressor-like protein